MKRAEDLAKKGEGFVSPNPCVGAVIVKNGRIIGEGWHKKAGMDHAEIVAIKDALSKGGNLKDTDLYVTLEPCCHCGKTPPCVDAVVKYGFKNVFIGMIDPFVQVKGRSAEILKKKGIHVEICTGKIADEIRTLNQPFIKWAILGLPYVVMKAGMSLDGKIATCTGESKWITSEQARKDGKFERNKCDAVLVGAGTVGADDPELGDKLRVIIDAELDLSIKSKVFRNKNVFIACTDEAITKNKVKFEKLGIEFKSFGKKRIPIEKLLKFLGKRGIQNVFVEGGSEVNGSFFDEKMIDKVIFYIAPKLIGGAGLSIIGGKGIKKLNELRKLDNFSIIKVGKDFKAVGILNSY